jgi:Cu2+-exporting ATPase
LLGSEFMPPVLGAVVFFYCEPVFTKDARAELADRRPGMMTLLSLAIVVAFVTELAATVGLFQIVVSLSVPTSRLDGWTCRRPRRQISGQ